MLNKKVYVHKSKIPVVFPDTVQHREVDHYSVCFSTELPEHKGEKILNMLLDKKHPHIEKLLKEVRAVFQKHPLIKTVEKNTSITDELYTTSVYEL